MDTGSHLLFGATLAGVATLDPAVAANPDLAQAVLTAALIGSHAPDFDTVSRLKGYEAYFRFHRGITHSLPAMLVWPALISIPVALGFHVMDQLAHLYIWTMLAVISHVFLDLLNTYGVQCFRPFNDKWHHWDVLSLFDPFLFAIHLGGLIAWMNVKLSPGPMFLGIYGVSFMYIGCKAILSHNVVRRVKASIFKAENDLEETLDMKENA